MTQSNLLLKKCRECAPGTPPLTAAQINVLLPKVGKWQVVDGELTRTFKFKNYHESMAFVNATAWVSHQQNHHPDINLGYNTVKIRYATHSIGGLSKNDFICAAKVNALLAT